MAKAYRQRPIPSVSPARGTGPTVIAHRGLCSKAPEATRAAYEQARDLGVDYLEGDLQRTQDGAIVIRHDKTLERTTNVRELFPHKAKLGIGAFSLEELQQLDAGSFFNKARPRHARPEFVGEKILQLADLVEIAEAGDGKVPGLCLESKAAHRYPGIEGDIVDELKRLGWISADGNCLKPVIFESFELASLREFQRLAPGVPRLFLTAGNRPFHRILADAESVGASAIGGVHFRSGPLNIWRAHKRGIAVYPWTVNPNWLMRLLSGLGADGLFTNRADSYLDLLSRTGLRP